jgi:hypothetical protein
MLPALLDLGDGPNHHDALLSKNSSKNAIANNPSSLATFGWESSREAMSDEDGMILGDGPKLS